MSKKLQTEIKLAGVNIVDPRTIDMAQAISVIVLKLNLQIDKRTEWINAQTINVLKRPVRYGKRFRRDIQNNIHVYNDNIECIKTQLLLLGKPYGQN